MRKRKIRALVGFPLGVFTAVTLFLIIGVISRNTSVGLTMSYLFSGFTGILSISIATLFTDESDSILKEAFICAVCTFVLVSIMFICIQRMKTLMGIFMFLMIYFMILSVLYVYLDYKTKKEVSMLNQLNERRKQV